MGQVDRRWGVFPNGVVAGTSKPRRRLPSALTEVIDDAEIAVIRRVLTKRSRSLDNILFSDTSCQQKKYKIIGEPFHECLPSPSSATPGSSQPILAIRNN